MRGDGRIHPVPQEESVRAERHRCLVARKDIAVGDLFTIENVALKRPSPGNAGLAPRYFDQVMGCTARRPLQRDDKIVEQDVAGLK